MKPSLRPLLLAVMFTSSSQVYADSPRLRFSGFGTLGYVATDSSDVVYHRVSAQDGADNKGSLEVDSRIGVQANAELSSRYSATLQILAREDADGDFTPAIEWAFVKAQLLPMISLRLGRIGAPVFMVSDFREVGYANTLLRPPEDTYSQIPIRTFDGADVNGQFELGETLLNAQVFIGSGKSEFPMDQASTFDDVAGVNITLEYGIARLRLGHVTTRLSLHSSELDALSQALTAAASQVPSLVEVANDFTTSSRRAGFSGLGLELDLDPWFVTGELTQRRIRDSFLADTTGWYLAAGYRWNDFTPYASVSALRQDSRTQALPFPQIPELAPLEAGVNATYSTSDQNTVALGVRWDPVQNIAVKAQVEHVRRELDGDNFDNLDPSVNGESVKLFSLGIDFVF